jgi:hypothetical protein
MIVFQPRAKPSSVPHVLETHSGLVCGDIFADLLHGLVCGLPT